MEKYCTSCRRVFKDSDYKLCPYCGRPLNSRVGRQPIPNRLRHAVFQKDKYRCRECGRGKEDGVSLEIDHIIPVAKGGTNDINNLQTLCKDCNRGKATDEWVGGEYTTRTANIKKVKVLSVQEKNEIRIKKFSDTVTDNQLKLLYNHFPNIKHSRIEIIEFLVSNFSDSYIERLLVRLKEQRDKFFVDLSDSITDNQLELLYDSFPNVNHSKKDMMQYLYENYPFGQIKTLLYDLQQKKKDPSKRFNKLELHQNLTPERMGLLKLLNNNEDYLISELLLSFSGNQIDIILKELDNIINQLNELDEQKNKQGFCILGLEDIWYYYYLTPLGEYLRFYAVSKQELKIIALNKNLPWYDEFTCNISSEDTKVRKFIARICVEIHIDTNKPHERHYSMKSTTLTSKRLYDEVICHLGSLSESKPPKDLFKPVINLNSLPDTITCPNCGKTIFKRAVRCKYCKTMMRDLITMVNHELELYGFNLDDIEII